MQPDCRRHSWSDRGRFALVLTGGGARAAYQVGFLRFLASEFSDFSPDVLTGVSAGAINAAYLAAHPGSFRERIESLADLWASLSIDDVFRVDMMCLARNVARWSARLLSGGSQYAPRARSLVDTQPLHTLLGRVLDAEHDVLTGIDRNIASGSLSAVALTASSYATGQSVTWVRGCEIQSWKRPDRKSIGSPLTVQHVMASSALPLVFPAVQIDGTWYGDGGVGLTAPLSPAVHLGASRILAISTRATRREIEPDLIDVYPSPARVAGLLLDAIFVDLLDADAQRLERINSLVGALADPKRSSLRQLDLLVARPSEDLDRIARAHEPQLPSAFRFLTRGLGTREPRSSGVLSMIMFQPDYLRRLLDLGEADAAARVHELRALLKAA
jgi:NTE family protein